MTTILGIQGNGFAVVCSDSGLSDEHNSLSYTSCQPKITANGKYLLGVAGDGRAFNILSDIFIPPTVRASLRGRLLDKFITAVFIPALRECFETTGYATPVDAENIRHIAQHDSTILVVINGQIYIIDDDYSWYQDTSGLYAIGTGAELAYGAMSALLGSKKPNTFQCRKVVLRTIAVSAKYDHHTSPPFHVFVQTT